MNEVTIHYERKLSDGNYGSEGVSCSTTFSHPGEPITDEDFAATVAALRRSVLGQLSKSAAQQVAWAAQRELNPPPPRQAVAAGAPADLEDMPF